MKLRNHFVVARSHNAQHPLSTRSRRVGHSFGDACCCFDGFTRPASFLQRYNTNKTEYTGSLRWGDDRRDTSHNEHTTLQSSRNSQACLLTTMQSKWYNIKCSHMTTLIYPITDSASILMIAPRSSPTSVGTWLQSAQGTATGPRRNIGSLVPVLPYTEPAHMAPQATGSKFPHCADSSLVGD